MNDLQPESELDRKQREGLRRRSDLAAQRDKAAKAQMPQEQTALDPESTWTGPAPQKNRAVIFFLLLSLISIPIAFKILNTHQPHATPQVPAPLGPLSFIENASPADLDHAIESVIRGFMTATTNEERCLYVRGGLSRLEQMEEFYTRPGIEPPSSFHRIIQSEPASFQGVPVYAVLATAGEGEPALLFQVVPTPGGVCIDWEVTVGYGQIPWETLLAEKPKKPKQVRVYLKRAPFPLHFPEPASYHFCLIKSRESSSSITACFPRNTPLADHLKKIVPPSASQPVNLELRWNQDLQLFEVTQLIHNFWMNPLVEAK